jgi:hypothetical protein
MAIATLFKWFFGLIFILITLITADIRSGYKLPVSNMIYGLILSLTALAFYGAIYL